MRHAGLPRRRVPPSATREGGSGERASREGGSNSVVESQPSKLLVAGSIPVSRSNLRSLSELRLASRVAREGLTDTADLSAAAVRPEGGPPSQCWLVVGSRSDPTGAKAD